MKIEEILNLMTLLSLNHTLASVKLLHFSELQSSFFFLFFKIKIPIVNLPTEVLINSYP